MYFLYILNKHPFSNFWETLGNNYRICSSKSGKKTIYLQHIFASHYLLCIFLCPQSWFTLSHVSFTFSTRSLYHLISLSLHLVYFLPYGLLLSLHYSSVSFHLFLPHLLTCVHTRSLSSSIMCILHIFFISTFILLTLPSVLPSFLRLFLKTYSESLMTSCVSTFFFCAFQSGACLRRPPRPLHCAVGDPPSQVSLSPTASCESESHHFLEYQNISRDLLYWCRNIQTDHIFFILLLYLYIYLTLPLPSQFGVASSSLWS